MTMVAALRHEQENLKHREKVEQEAQQAEFDMLPSHVNAWEWSSCSQRVDDFVPFWLHNIAAANAGVEGESMDSFVGRYNEKYRDWVLEEWKRENGWSTKLAGDEGWFGAVDDPAAWGAPANVPGITPNAWDDIPGEWYGGGSFFPHQEGTFQYGHQTTEEGTVEMHSPEEPMPPVEGVWDLPPVDPYEAWGVPKNERPSWPAAPAGSDEPVWNGSAAKQPQGPQRSRRYRRGGQRGKGPQHRGPAGNADRLSYGQRKQQQKIQ